MTKSPAQLDAEISEALRARKTGGAHAKIGPDEVSRLIAALDRYGARATELLEAGWYFEEGGCFGMALAIADAIKAAGGVAQLAVRAEPGVHAIVRVRERGVDWQGTVSNLTGYRTMSRERFYATAAKYGHDAAALQADQRWAAETIQLALELAAESKTP
jgi:hypothetical protein